MIKMINFRCKHVAICLRYRDGAKKRHYNDQCLTCGLAIGPEYLYSQIICKEDVEPWDEQLELLYSIYKGTNG